MGSRDEDLGFKDLGFREWVSDLGLGFVKQKGKAMWQFILTIKRTLREQISPVYTSYLTNISSIQGPAGVILLHVLHGGSPPPPPKITPPNNLRGNNNPNLPVKGSGPPACSGLSPGRPQREWRQAASSS